MLTITSMTHTLYDKAHAFWTPTQTPTTSISVYIHISIKLNLSRSFLPAMDDLPKALVVEILSRLNDSFDLAHCRLTSKSLNTLSDEVKSINLQCSFERYTKSRCPRTSSQITPFKTIFKSLISRSTNVDSVSIGIERPLRSVSYDEVEDEDDDLYLTDVNFVNEWLPTVSERLKSLSISDFWVQSCWRRSEILSFISSHCHSLQELDLKNAWLSVDRLNSMPMLKSLTLEFIRLDDEDLNRLNDCFPSLQVLNLIGVGGLNHPRIHLLHLKICQWTVSNAPSSLTVVAPNLIKLKLRCVKPKSLVIEAPLLSSFHLFLDKAGDFKVKEFLNLRTVQLETTNLCNLLYRFPFGRTICNLTVDSMNCGSVEYTECTLQKLLDIFPCVSSLTLGAGAWTKMVMDHCTVVNGNQMKEVKKITAYLVVPDIEMTLSYISFILEKCTNLLDMALLIHRDVVSTVVSNLMSRCSSYSSRVRWKWGMWKEGTSDAWM